MDLATGQSYGLWVKACRLWFWASCLGLRVWGLGSSNPIPQVQAEKLTVLIGIPHNYLHFLMLLLCLLSIHVHVSPKNLQYVLSYFPMDLAH